MEHIQDPVDEPPMPFKGRNPQRGRAVDWKMRRSKKGDHGFATQHLMRQCNQGTWMMMGHRNSQQRFAGNMLMHPSRKDFSEVPL